jgi:hypothetical protein
MLGSSFCLESLQATEEKQVPLKRIAFNLPDFFHHASNHSLSFLKYKRAFFTPLPGGGGVATSLNEKNLDFLQTTLIPDN